MVSEKPRIFETDGVRGRVGSEFINDNFAYSLARAFSHYCARETEKTVVLVGRDTRQSGRSFEVAIIEAIKDSNLRPLALGVVPTPLLSFACMTRSDVAGAIVISASHNPYGDNGFKFFDSSGHKLPVESELQVELLLRANQKIYRPDSGEDSISYDTKIKSAYENFILGSIKPDLNFLGLKIVVDCANGSFFDIAPKVLEKTGAKIITVGCNPNGRNINDQVGSTTPQTVKNSVLKHRADIGIAFDGDGDRLSLVTSNGRLLDGDDILFLLSILYKKQYHSFKEVVGTVMTNFALEKDLLRNNIRLERTEVGDRNISQMMTRKGYVLGGESSGHIICGDFMATGDGLLAAMRVLELIFLEEKSLDSLILNFEKTPQVLVNVNVLDKYSVLDNSSVKEVIKSAELDLVGIGRILVRPSGTEPVIRVMVEGTDKSKVHSVSARVASYIGNIYTSD